ncbi:MAG: hypothetical protein U0174_16965 [Polyangiaceae bacterium]
MLPRSLDRGTVKLMAVKRLITGSLSVVLGVGAIVFAVQRQAAGGVSDTQTKLMFVLLLLICFGGGGWSLRDGIRTLRMIRKA